MLKVARVKFSGMRREIRQDGTQVRAIDILMLTNSVSRYQPRSTEAALSRETSLRRLRPLIRLSAYTRARAHTCTGRHTAQASQAT